MPSLLLVDQLRVICPALALHRAQSLVEAINPAAERFGINQTDDRFAAWLAQCAHESQGFTRSRENTYYKTVERVREVFERASRYSNSFIRGYLKNPEAFANWIYGGMLGNGPEKSGDGWRFRGGGITGLTFRANYREMGKVLDLPLEEQPELIERDDVSALTAAYFWQSRGCNEIADKLEGDDETRALRRKINGGFNGLANVIEYALKADRAFGLR